MKQKNVGGRLGEPKNKKYSLTSKLHSGAVTYKFRTASGITLVALVVTIIVLLILAGVSINLVAGSNGILGKATKAVDITNMAKIKEEIELKIAESQMDYYMKDNNFANVNDYVKAELEKGVELSNGAEIRVDSSGKLSYEGLEIGTLNSDGSVTIDGELSGNQIVSKYAVSYNPNGGQGGPSSKKYAAGESVTIDFTTKPTKKGAFFLGWATSSTATTPEYTSSGSFSMGSQNVTLYAVWEKLVGTAAIKPEYYGDNVNYSANDVSDWQVFLNDGSNVYIISADVVPSNKMTLGTGISKVENSLYTVYANSQANFVNWLTTTSNWINYASGFTGISATGGPTLAQFVQSYNAKYGTNYSSDVSQESWILENKSAPMYIIGSTKTAHGYWLASENLNDETYMGSISVGGLINKNYGYTDQNRGVRPLVKLPENAKMSWNGTAWDLSE